MTDENQEQKPDQDNPLLAKNRQLLDELKQARVQIQDLTTQLDASQSKVTDITLTRPAQKLLDSVSAGRYASMELADHFKFALDDSGALQVTNAQGEPLMTGTIRSAGGKKTLVDERRVEATENDFYNFLTTQDGKFNTMIRGSRATGGGAIGGGYGRHVETKKPASEVPGNKFGLGAK